MEQSQNHVQRRTSVVAAFGSSDVTGRDVYLGS
jgi:hypothetical protein